MRRLRWWVVAAALLAGCSTDGEGWAQGTLGVTGAELIRGEARLHLHGARHYGQNVEARVGSETPSTTPYVRRPLVVLKVADDPKAGEPLVFHHVNTQLPDAMRPSKASMVRGIIIVSTSQRCRGETAGDGACKGETETVTELILVDRDRGTQLLEHLSSPADALLQHLVELPAQPPGDS